MASLSITLPCGAATDVGSLLEGCTNSLPQHNQILYICSHCGEELPIRVTEGSLQAGPNTDPVPLKELRTYVDLTYGIDCLFEGRLYHMPKLEPLRHLP